MVVPSALLRFHVLPWNYVCNGGPSPSAGRFSLMTCEAAFLTLAAHSGVTPRVTEHPTFGHVRKAVSWQTGHCQKKRGESRESYTKNLHKMLLKIIELLKFITAPGLWRPSLLRCSSVRPALITAVPDWRSCRFCPGLVFFGSLAKTS